MEDKAKSLNSKEVNESGEEGEFSKSRQENVLKMAQPAIDPFSEKTKYVDL